MELLGRDDLDLGPDEHEMTITDAELQSAQQKEIVRLQSELHNLRINNKRVSKRHQICTKRILFSLYWSLNLSPYHNIG